MEQESMKVHYTKLGEGSERGRLKETKTEYRREVNLKREFTLPLRFPRFRHTGIIGKLGVCAITST